MKEAVEGERSGSGNSDGAEPQPQSYVMGNEFNNIQHWQGANQLGQIPQNIGITDGAHFMPIMARQHPQQQVTQMMMEGSVGPSNMQAHLQAQAQQQFQQQQQQLMHQQMIMQQQQLWIQQQNQQLMMAQSQLGMQAGAPLLPNPQQLNPAIHMPSSQGPPMNPYLMTSHTIQPPPNFQQPSIGYFNGVVHMMPPPMQQLNPIGFQPFYGPPQATNNFQQQFNMAGQPFNMQQQQHQQQQLFLQQQMMMMGIHGQQPQFAQQPPIQAFPNQLPVVGSSLQLQSVPSGSDGGSSVHQTLEKEQNHLVSESPYDESLFSQNIYREVIETPQPKELEREKSGLSGHGGEEKGMQLDEYDQPQHHNSNEQVLTNEVTCNIREGAFKRFVPSQKKGEQEETKVAKNEKVILEESVFSISENIKMMLLSDETQATVGVINQQPPPKRSSGNFLGRLTVRIVETLKKCNAKYNYQPITMNPKRDLTSPSEGVLNNGYDNVDSDYILRVSDLIISPEGREYQIHYMLGKGTFGQVVQCECIQTKELVAIKVIKNKKAFKNQGVVEIKILDILNRVYDPSGESPIVRMLDFFVFRDHLCIVFELLAVSLYDTLKKNFFQGLSLNTTRLMISQILDAMKVAKDAKLIHCDLKPENILLKTKDNPNLKVIDFGSACFEGHAIFQYIQSRYYRSPEVLLGLPYDYAIDMWSLGCIAAELFLGIPIFPGNSEYDQLSRIIEIIGPIPQYMIHRAKYKDKYFFYIPQIGQYRFKTMEEYQNTTGVRLEPPRRYLENFNCLDDLKFMFLQKKQKEQSEVDAQNQQKRVQSLVVLESELNAMDSFIDFLKGVLRLDKDLRWTPTMAMQHPFITREQFQGPFEPRRDNDKNSANDNTGNDTMSEKSSSSKESKDYKAGSCPSKILYPQTASVPYYMQAAQQPPAQQQNAAQQPQFQKQQVQRQQFVNTLGQNIGVSSVETPPSTPLQRCESHRPPILSIPDEFFKGFMFGRLDQILSMTKEQLYQFIYEQQEMQFRQQAQRMMMQQQQQAQYQQYMMMQQQMRIQGQPQQPGASFNLANNFGRNPMNGGPHQIRPLQGFQQQLPQNQFQAGQPPHGGIIMQPLQQFMGPSEQIIYNPPPYSQQKQQLHMTAAQMGDPQYQTIMAQQQQQQRKLLQAQQYPQNRGKAGSWHAPNALQAQKYNQYYNQINNPGQLIGRQQPQQYQPQSQFPFNNEEYFQQTFYPVPIELQANNPQSRNSQGLQRDSSSTSSFKGDAPVATALGGVGPGPSPRAAALSQVSKLDLSKTSNLSNSKRKGKLVVGSSESLQSLMIEEEKEKLGEKKTTQKVDITEVPFPDTKNLFIASHTQGTISNYASAGLASIPKKPSTENLHQISEGWIGSQIGSARGMQPSTAVAYDTTPPSNPRNFNYQQLVQPHQAKPAIIGSQQLIDQQYQQLTHSSSMYQSNTAHKKQFPSPKLTHQNTFQGISNTEGAIFGRQESFKNSSVSQKREVFAAAQTQEAPNLPFLSSNPQKSFLNKVQQSSQNQNSQQQPGSNSAGIFNKQYRKYNSKLDTQGVPEQVPSVSSQSSYRNRSNSDQIEQYDEESNRNVGNVGPQMQFHAPHQHPWATSGLIPQTQGPIKLDQPIHRLLKGQQPGSLTLEQMILQKQSQKTPVQSFQAGVSNMEQPFSQRAIPIGQQQRVWQENSQFPSHSQDLLNSSYKNQVFFDEGNQQDSIFDQHQNFFQMQQQSPRKVSIVTPGSANSSGSKLSGSGLKITQRQSSNHTSMGIAKNLTPIDESRFIEEDHHFTYAQPSEITHTPQQRAEEKHDNILSEEEEDRYDFHQQKQKDPYSSSSSNCSQQHSGKKRRRRDSPADDDDDY